MAATNYTYSIPGDFPGTGFNSDRLVEDVEASAIVTALTRIASSGYVVDVWFADPLSGGDETILDGLIAVHSGIQPRPEINVITDPSMEAVEPGAAVVVANGRPALEVAAGNIGWGAILARWPYDTLSVAKLCICLKFILKATGTGTVARIGARAKAQGAGEDSSDAWADVRYEDATVSHTTLGEVFEVHIVLDASDFDLNDALALQVGRDGEHANDVVDVAIQIMGVQAEAF